MLFGLASTQEGDECLKRRTDRGRLFVLCVYSARRSFTFVMQISRPANTRTMPADNTRLVPRYEGTLHACDSAPSTFLADSPKPSSGTPFIVYLHSRRSLCADTAESRQDLSPDFNKSTALVLHSFERERIEKHHIVIASLLRMELIENCKYSATLSDHGLMSTEYLLRDKE